MYLFYQQSDTKILIIGKILNIGYGYQDNNGCDFGLSPILFIIYV